MNSLDWTRVLASVILQSSPIIIAVVGETITERSGIINLSVDGSMLMATMSGFVTALYFNNLWIGFLVGALVGMIFALIVAFGSITLNKSQVAIGFVLTLLGDDLSAFLGQKFTRIPGPVVKHFPIPILKDIPFIGPIFFNQDIVVYFAYVLVFLAWLFLRNTQPGLRLRSVGERPESAFARGVNVNKLRYLYAAVGGLLIGIGGASYSLDVKIGWSDGHIRGIGWIVLAIVIFGGWSPIRGALGALLFGATKVLATILQRTFPQVSVVAFNTIPWILMILVLLVSSSEITERIIAFMPKRFRPQLRRILRIAPPMALGTTFVDK